MYSKHIVWQEESNNKGTSELYNIRNTVTEQQIQHQEKYLHLFMQSHAQ